jgi:stage V sporulation protein G
MDIGKDAVIRNEQNCLRSGLTIDDVFVVHDIKIIDGEKGLFIAMPSRKSQDGEYRDIVHPINQETRTFLQNLILDKYQEELAKEPDLF